MSKDMVEQIADCLLQNHMELMAEVKHLRDELERLLVRTPLSHDRLWEMWNADVDDNSPERFNEFLHAARLIEKTHGIGERTEAETIANDRLIAAAPDMLEALKLIQNQDLVLPADREIIKSAIAKATGER